jgi:hypothetical protein
MDFSKLIEDLIEIDKKRNVSYYLPLDSSTSIPKNLFEDEYSLQKMKDCLNASKEQSVEAKIYGFILSNTYKISEIILGKKEFVLGNIKFTPTTENPFAPYQAQVFDLHTHPLNLVPSIIDLFGVNSTHEGSILCLSEGSLHETISHKSSRINPIYIIGRNIEDRMEFLCYEFEKETIPELKTHFDRNNFVLKKIYEVEAKLYTLQQMSGKDAKNKDLDFYVDAMNSCEGIKAFGKTI